LKAADKLVKICREKGIRIAVAESCTGGLVCSAITSVPGSSSVFDRGFITYSSESKIELLSVSESFIRDKDTVSVEVATEMAVGAIKNSNADIAISITGIAGPGSEANKPVGLVYFGLYHGGEVKSFKKVFSGDRTQIRALATDFALELLLEAGNIN
jgi:PncC family amidohydrolase